MCERECKKHGVTEYYKDHRGYYRCKKCRSESVVKARQRRKEKLIEMAGGCCEICGYDKCSAALQFHHNDPSEKSFSLSNGGRPKKLEEQIEEIKKCTLLCANCHAESHHNAKTNQTIR